MADKEISLKGKVCLVTGASRGLGRALAREFGRRGASLVVVSRRPSRDELLALEKDLAAGGVPVLAVSADVSNRADVERLAGESLLRFQKVDVLVNNASVLGPVPVPSLLHTRPDDFEEVLRVNLLGPFLLTQALVGPMLGRGRGSIINVSADAGLAGSTAWGAYGVSKAALDQLTRTWAAELDGSGVRINSVDPGEMDTDMSRAFEAAPGEAHWPPPEAAAAVFVYLASDRSAGLNGRRLNARQFNSEQPGAPAA